MYDIKDKKAQKSLINIYVLKQGSSKRAWKSNYLTGNYDGSTDWPTEGRTTIQCMFLRKVSGKV